MRVRIVAWCVALGGLPEPAVADPFAAFRIPEHVTRSASARATLGADWDRQVYHGQSNRRDRFDAGLGIRTAWARDSDATALGASAALDHDGTRSRSRTDWTEERQSSRAEWFQHALRLSGRVRHYPWSRSVGVELSVQAAQQYRRDANRFDRFSQNGGVHEARDQRVLIRQVTASATLGLGRVRDATPVYAAFVVEKRLRDAGALRRPLSHGARQRLADLFAIESDYAVPHDRPRRFFWREVEHILTEDGTLGPEGLRAYDVEHLNEPVLGPALFLGASSFESRRRGVFAGVAVAQQHEHQRFQEEWVVSRDDGGSVQTSRGSQALDRLAAGPDVAAHRPFGMRWQAGIESRCLFPLRDGEDGFELVSRAELRWLVTDRWRVAWDASHQRTVFESRREPSLSMDRWFAAGSASLSYWLEDRIELSLSLGTQQQGSTAWGRDTALRFSTAYRFFGALDAPDLLVSERPFIGP